MHRLIMLYPQIPVQACFDLSSGVLNEVILEFIVDATILADCLPFRAKNNFSPSQPQVLLLTKSWVTSTLLSMPMLFSMLTMVSKPTMLSALMGFQCSRCSQHSQCSQRSQWSQRSLLAVLRSSAPLLCFYSASVMPLSIYTSKHNYFNLLTL